MTPGRIFRPKVVPADYASPTPDATLHAENARLRRELEAARFRAAYLQHWLRAAVGKLHKEGLLDEQSIKEWASLVIREAPPDPIPEIDRQAAVIAQLEATICRLQRQVNDLTAVVAHSSMPP